MTPPTPPPTSHPRRALASAVTVEGIGLFTEQPVRCLIRPAEVGAGVQFVRTDLPANPTIPATINALCTTPVHPAFAQIPPRHTALVSPETAEGVVYTTEHLLAALAGLGITDATIELNAPELPIGEGSAQLFTDAILQTEIVTLDSNIEPLTIAEPVVVKSPDGHASIRAEPIGPNETPSYSYELDYGRSAPIQPQTATWHADPQTGSESFRKNIAPARTFSLAAEAAQMQGLGLFTAFTPRDLLVIDETGSPLDNAWRFDNEPARHKLLDLIGDLALVGCPLHACITSTCGGHALNHAMAQALVVGTSPLRSDFF